MLKKILAILIFILIVVLLGIKSPKATKVTTLTFSSWGSETEINLIKPIISEFEKIHPNIKIKFLHIPQNYFQKLHLLFASNTQPDVIFINNLYLPIYANANVLEPLENYFTKEDLRQYYPQVLQSMKYKDNLYAIPRDVSNLVIFYNKDIFNKYKIPYPNKNWDFDEFLQTCQKLTHLPDVFGISFEDAPYFYLPYVMSEGGNFLPEGYNTSQTRQALNFYANLRTKYHVAPQKQELSGATSTQLFLEGRLGMILNGRWVVPKFREDAQFDWDVINFPKGKAGSLSPIDSSGWAIAKNSRYKNEAVLFIKYLSSTDSIAKITKTGLIVPARIDVANSNVFNDSQKPHNSRVFIDVMKTSKPTPVSINYNEILDSIKTENEMLFNKK